ncbi:MAG: UbiA family prenyltransferase [Candidatus Thermoplasmatota archaeon]|nr:UbiA family prenyltransferase [Candidatus Thermoplasmatota archaeon]
MSSEVRIRKEVHVTPQDLTGFIVSLGGVKFWIVAIFPMYVGWVLAQNPFGTAGRHLFVDQLGVVLGFLVIGPLLGTFALLLNVYFDMMDTDRANPRKQYVRVIEDLMDRETILYAAWGFALIGLLLAFYISQNLVVYTDPGGPVTAIFGPYTFFGLTVLAVILSVLYSHPAVRWKGVPGMDVLVNVVGFGIIAPLAGWALLRPIEGFPLWYLASIAFFVVSVYVPTTASDYESDRQYDIRTTAVALGVRRALVVGFAFLLGAIFLLAYGDALVLFPFDGPATHALTMLWPFLAAQIVLYAAFLRRPTQAKIWALLLLLSILQALATFLFLFQFTAGQTYA